MSRLSSDLVDASGIVKTGYDYNLQAWVKDYKILPCGHPEDMKASGCCFAGQNAGKDVRQLVGHEVRRDNDPL